MNDLTEMVNSYTIKYDRKIKAICAPLKECLGISSYSYFRIEKDGLVIDLSNHVDLLSLYYNEKLYLSSPLDVHPMLLRSGYLLTPQTFDPDYFKLIFRRCQINNMLIILQHHGDYFEGTSFGLTTADIDNSSILLNNIELLNRFTNHFKKEMKSIINYMRSDGFNMRRAKGEAFQKNNLPFPLLNKDPSIQRFLKLVHPLSHRERQCLDFFKQGKSAQMTGAMLGLSQRTVEFYFGNIKDKLGCRTKAELLEW